MKKWTDEECDELWRHVYDDLGDQHFNDRKLDYALIRAAVDEAKREEREACVEITHEHVCRLSGHEFCDCQADIRTAILARYKEPNCLPGCGQPSAATFAHVPGCPYYDKPVSERASVSELRKAAQALNERRLTDDTRRAIDALADRLEEAESYVIDQATLANKQRQRAEKAEREVEAHHEALMLEDEPCGICATPLLWVNQRR